MTANDEDQDIAARLQAIVDYVQDCERRVRQGEIMDLKGLDQHVVDICNEITTLPRAESQPLEKNMSQLIEHLEALAGEIKNQQGKYQAAGGT